jgi:hypothetical protein
MQKSDPFLLSAAEMATTETMRADETIPQDWRYIDIPWQHAAIFDKIVKIGGADMRVLDSSQRGAFAFEGDRARQNPARARVFRAGGFIPCR